MSMVVDKVVFRISFSSLFFNQTPTPALNKTLYYYSQNNNFLNSSKKFSHLTWPLGVDHNNKKKVVGASSHSSNYVVAFDSSSCITRPLAEILRDLNKRIPDNIIISNNKPATTTVDDDEQDSVDPYKTYIPWYHANRMLSFYAPGWCGEIRDVIFSDNGSVTVVYRVTIRGSDGEAHRESTGTVSPLMNGHNLDAVAAAEEIAFCRACARFGLGLYLYHDE